MKKVKLEMKNIKWILIALIAFTIVFAVINIKGLNKDTNTLTISVNGEAVHQYKLSEIKQMEAIILDKTIVSAKHNDESGEFKGVLLKDILNQVDENLLKDHSRVLTKAEDGFTSAFYSDEIEEEGNVLVVYEKDGEDLGTREAKGTGPLRIIVKNDEFGNRSTKYLNNIDFR